MDNDDKDLNLAMRLQLRDIDVFEAAQRGRKGKGCPTDYEVALGLMREDIAAELNWTDYRSRNLRNMDAVSEDHLAISETKSEDSESFQNLGSVSMTGGKLSCDSCYENVDKLACTSPCEHGFCRDCARKLILGAIQEEILYPPRCCNHVISRQVISSVLSYEQLQEFNNKAVEYESKQKLYCADPVCSSFISSTDIKDEHGTCTRCHRETHIPCRSLAHPKNMDCPKDTGIQQLLKTAEKERWKRCSKCRRVVELAQGCNHITCL
ncbi:hypothetical protein N7478_006936 [Penicillium angulare]|uniref:uncharacterized protein n=1 Tax=Penicillium angulare TaxID=116970 RepID=UPI0025419F7A|nr:uncharacterized protein N7478_006936 [Penicillium angulare]KAJ5281564.1 hypothetical protein N7478_006936 [Penicillium angulare]